MRHIVAISGGKDSTALALYLRDKSDQDYEYAFCDTGREFPDTLRFVNDLEDILGQKIHRLDDYGRKFDDYLERWNYFLPGAASRWCTKHLKLRPFERFCKKELPCTVYLAIRSDEPNTRGNLGLCSGISYAYPFRDDGIDLDGVVDILESHNIILPDYYKWRSTGGCYMCPWQRVSEWVRLKKYHPDLFELAVADEEKARSSSRPENNTTWSLRRVPLLKMIEDDERQGKLFDDDIIDPYLGTRPCTICAK